MNTINLFINLLKGGDMKNSRFFFLTIFMVHLLSSLSFGQIYSTDFENYTAGELLACQDSSNWTTWSLTPCDPVEDAYISTNYPLSGTKSLVILPNDDIIKPLGNLTSGSWHISFDVFFPTGKAGYYNLLASFSPNPVEWAIEVYFPDGGVANVNAGGSNSAFFVFPYDAWFPVEVIVDLDLNQAELKVNNTQIYVWQWTLGATGSGCSLMLAAVDFFGLYSNNEMYIDNFWFGDFPVSAESEVDNPLVFSLQQNYPNPFNPSTSIQYAISSRQFVTLKVYDVLGNEIATLVNEELPAGEYEVEFNPASSIENPASGIYFYKLQAGSFVETKKMILMK
jgi:hypothetical protein